MSTHALQRFFRGRKPRIMEMGPWRHQPRLASPGVGWVEAAGSASPQFHTRRTRGRRCNAGRALPAAGREHAGRGRPLEVFPEDGTKEEEAVPSPRRSQTASSPRPSRFLEPSACRGAPPDEKRGKGEGERGHTLQARGATRRTRARPLRCPPPETASTPPAPRPSALPSSRVPVGSPG